MYLVIAEEERSKILELYNNNNRILMVEGSLKGISFDEFMEKFRQSLFSPAGIAIESFLSSFAITAPSVIVSYSALLGYDVYKSVNGGETNWFDIIIDTLCVISSGVLSKLISPLLKYRNSIKSIDNFIEFIRTTKLWNTIYPWLKKITTGISFIIQKVNQGIVWLSNKTGLTFLIKLSGKISSILNNVSNTILNVLEEKSKQLVNKTVGSALKKSGKVYAQQSAITGGMNYGAEKIGQNRITKIKPTSFDIDSSKQIDFNIQ